MTLISNLKIAILAADGVAQSELVSPREALEEAGITVHIISPHPVEVRAWDKDDWGIRIKVDKTIGAANAEEYDGLFLPGGVLHADALRMNPLVIAFLKYIFARGKLVSAISHGPQLLIDAQVVSNKQLTSHPAIRIDLINAGGLWINQDVVVDNGLVTGRLPDDLYAFNKKLLEELREGIHQRTETII